MKQRILVVEDETAIASVLDALLTEAGYEVTLATDGVQGLQAFHRQSFSLILLDLMMPRWMAIPSAANPPGIPGSHRRAHRFGRRGSPGQGLPAESR